MPTFPTFTHIKFGDGLVVTDEGSHVIRVDAVAGAGGGGVPSPCAPLPGGSGALAGMDYLDAVAHLAITHPLRASWRLGEGGFPYVDTVTNSLYTNMTNDPGSGVAPTLNQTPGLLPTSIDDGAVAFNGQGGASGASNRHFFQPTGAGSSSFDFSPHVPFSLSCLIYPFAPTATWNGSIINFMSGNFGPSDPFLGWSLEVAYVAGDTDLHIIYRNYFGIGGTHFVLTSTATISVNERHFIMVTDAGPSRLMTLYIDGLPAGSGTDPGDHMAFSSFFTPDIGNYTFGAGTPNAPFYGIVDEIVLWSGAFTATEVIDLYNSVASAEAGWILTADGECDFSWQPPPPSGGVADTTFTFTQGSPSAIWSIVHSLGRFPSVSVVDTGGTEVIPTIQYINSNEIDLTFGSPTTGKAYLN